MVTFFKRPSVELFFSSDAYKDFLDKYKYPIDNFDTKLLYASYVGNLSMIKVLVSKGSNIIRYGSNALIMGSLRGHLSIVKFCLKSKPSYSWDKSTALQSASKLGHLSIVKYLAGNSTPINTDDNEALHLALINGRADVAIYLLGLYPRSIIITNRSIYDSIIVSGSIDILKYFNSRHSYKWNTYHLILAIKTGNEKFFKYFLDMTHDLKYSAALIFAIKQRNLQMVKDLINMGASAEVDNGHPLRLACELKQYDIVKFLIRLGANINVLNLQTLVELGIIKLINDFVHAECCIQLEMIEPNDFYKRCTSKIPHYFIYDFKYKMNSCPVCRSVLDKDIYCNRINN
jgi:ankyrin repeat protein